MWPRYAIGGAKMAEEIPPRPAPLQVIFDQIPHEPRYLNNWMLWRYEWKEGKDGKPGKWDKPPYQPNGKHASSTATLTWSPFKTVKAAYERGLNLPLDDLLHFDGVGFVPAKVNQADNNLQFGDLDRCRDKETGQLSPVAKEDLDLINSYCEISPSGTGILFIAKGHPSYPQGLDGSKNGPFELYQGRHYLTITGHRLEGYPATIEKRPDELNTFYERHFCEPEPTPVSTAVVGTGTNLTDDQIICLASEAKNSKKFMALMAGNIEDYRFLAISCGCSRRCKSSGMPTQPFRPSG
jgi:putative DNA primase/helicase